MGVKWPNSERDVFWTKQSGLEPRGPFIEVPETFWAGKPYQNLEPWENRAVSFTFS